MSERRHENVAASDMTLAATWYARLDSNQRPSESELSGGQTGNPCGAVVSSILHKIEQRLTKDREPLRCNGSRSFWAFFKIVVKQ